MYGEEKTQNNDIGNRTSKSDDVCERKVKKHISIYALVLNG